MDGIDTNPCYEADPDRHPVVEHDDHVWTHHDGRVFYCTGLVSVLMCGEWSRERYDRAVAGFRPPGG